jgi:hypothetical protein
MIAASLHDFHVWHRKSYAPSASPELLPTAQTLARRCFIAKVCFLSRLGCDTVPSKSSPPIMPRDHLSTNQSDSDQDEKQENRNPAGNKSHASDKDDLDFVPVGQRDVEAVDGDDDESEMHRVLRPLLGLQRQAQRSRGAAANKYDDLHPFAQILSLSDLEACVALESAAFPEHERCSRDKVCLALLIHLNPPIQPTHPPSLGPIPKQQRVTFCTIEMNHHKPASFRRSRASSLDSGGHYGRLSSSAA